MSSNRTGLYVSDNKYNLSLLNCLPGLNLTMICSIKPIIGQSLNKAEFAYLTFQDIKLGIIGQNSIINLNPELILVISICFTSYQLRLPKRTNCWSVNYKHRQTL